MKLRTVGVVAVLCVVACGSRVDAADTPEDCTNAQLTEAQQIIAEHEIETTCTTLKLDAAGVPDLTNLAFCSDEKCTTTIKRVRKSMPSCLYNGKRLRAGMTKLVKACEGTATAKSGDDDSGSGSPNATTTPKTKKPTKTKTPVPTEGSSTGSSIENEEGDLIENEDEAIGSATEALTDAPTMAPETETPATVPTVAKASSSASTGASGTALLMVLSTVVLAFVC